MPVSESLEIVRRGTRNCTSVTSRAWPSTSAHRNTSSSCLPPRCSRRAAASEPRRSTCGYATVAEIRGLLRERGYKAHVWHVGPRRRAPREPRRPAAGARLRPGHQASLRANHDRHGAARASQLGPERRDRGAHRPQLRGISRRPGSRSRGVRRVRGRSGRLACGRSEALGEPGRGRLVHARRVPRRSAGRSRVLSLRVVGDSDGGRGRAAVRARPGLLPRPGRRALVQDRTIGQAGAGHSRRGQRRRAPSSNVADFRSCASSKCSRTWASSTPPRHPPPSDRQSRSGLAAPGARWLLRLQSLDGSSSVSASARRHGRGCVCTCPQRRRRWATGGYKGRFVLSYLEL